jgi:hypothetical protein
MHIIFLLLFLVSILVQNYKTKYNSEKAAHYEEILVLTQQIVEYLKLIFFEATM